MTDNRMTDREKVIRELERLSEWLFQQYQVVYDGDAPNYYDAYKTVDEAITLLKEHEPVAPQILDTAIPASKTAVRFVKTYWCGACGEAINQSDVYCRKCGQAVKWDE